MKSFLMASVLLVAAAYIVSVYTRTSTPRPQKTSLCPRGKYAYLTGIGKDANGNGYLATIMCLRDK